MSLESERRAIGSNNEATRRGTGQRMINDRAAIKAGISAARASTFKADLNALETSRRKQVTLTRREPKGARAATVGTGIYKAPAATGGTGGGIASPLTEKTKVVGPDTVPDRDYFAMQIITTSDGIFTFEVPPVHKLKLTDANAAAVEVVLAQPAP